jgi:hypothetical protein
VICGEQTPAATLTGEVENASLLAVNVTVAVDGATVTPSVVSVAVYVTASPVESFTVKEACPLPFVVPLTVVIVELPLPAASVTVLPLTRLLLASFSVTVIVEVEEPSAFTVVGLAVTVEFAALPGPAATTKVVVFVYVPKQPLLPVALILTPLDVPTGVVADVVTVSVEVRPLCVVKTSGLGLKVPLAPLGRPAMLIVAVQAEAGLMLTVIPLVPPYVAELPAGTGLGVCVPTVGALSPAGPDVTLKRLLIA